MTAVNGTARGKAAIRNYGRIEMENTCEKKHVGGMIFFIDSESTEEVEFFDIRGQKVNPSIGDMPHSYRVTKEGNRPKFWVFNSRMRSYKRWMPDSTRYTYLETLEKLGSGAENTEKAIGAFGIIYGEDQDTIWDFIVEMRALKVGGCDDWFVPSMEEMVKLREFFMANKESDQFVDPFDITSLWSSSGRPNYLACYWSCYYQEFGCDNKYGDNTVCGVRAF